jgi:oligopeptide transport system permease protein
MAHDTAPALNGPRPAGANLFLRSVPGLVGLSFLVLMLVACLGTLPWTLRQVADAGTLAQGPGRSTAPAFDDQNRAAQLLPPSWLPSSWVYDDQRERASALALDNALRAMADDQGVTIETLLAVRLAKQKDAGAMAIVAERLKRPAAELERLRTEPTDQELRAGATHYLMGTDLLGRSVLTRVLVGGGISLLIGLAAATLSVTIGVLYGALAGYVGGRVDGVMMRVVDVLYGLPYILLVVLLAVAVDAALDNWQASRGAAVQQQIQAYVDARANELGPSQRTPETLERLRIDARARLGTGELSDWQVQAINVVTLLVAIGGVSWLTMARVIRGQVLSLKAQPFVEAARAIGVSPAGIFVRHLLPNLVGPIVVYATLTVPQAILQESFLSFLGIGVKPPLPSWGNLASQGLQELNTIRSNWWLLVFPCLMLGMTLLALNFVGEGLREAIDPKRRGR